MIPGLIFLILFFSFILIKSADLVIVAIRRISKSSPTKTFTLSVLILAVGTSFPEFFVGITSALQGSPSISLGNITGSNIANIAVVGSLASIFVGRVLVRGEYLKRDVGIALAAGAMPFFLLLDGKLSRVDGLILLVVYLAYASSFFRARFIQIGKEQQEEGFVYRFLRQFNHIDAAKRRELGKLFVGLALLLFSADWIVKIAEYLASMANIPKFVVGLIIVSLGTTLPELAFSFRSLREREPQMFFGNLLGSTIANSTLIIGTVSLIRPIESFAVDKYYISAVAFIIIFLIFWLFVRTKHRLDRWEAFVLVCLYVLFVTVEFL